MILIGKGRGLSAVFAKDAGNLKKNILQERHIPKVCLRETDKFGKTQKPGPGELELIQNCQLFQFFRGRG